MRVKVSWIVSSPWMLIIYILFSLDDLVVELLTSVKVTDEVMIIIIMACSLS